jgi:hypothetical protein
MSKPKRIEPEIPQLNNRLEAHEANAAEPFELLSMKILFCCANSLPAVRSGVAQIFNLLYRRIAFGGAPGMGKSSDPSTASGLQIRDTAEYNSALLRLRLRRAMLFCGQSISV